MRRRPGWVTLICGAYVFLLLVSHVVRSLPSRPPDPGPGASAVSLPAVGGDGLVRVVYDDREPSGGGEAPVLLLLHGSPGRRADFAGLIPALGSAYRVIAPDLPGFGDSERDPPDYSAAAHADYMVEFLDRLGVDRVHVVGFSMGGVVAVELAARDPERLASITLLSATGVQELELLGDRGLNRIVHGAQLGALWFVHEMFPHMGLLDGTLLDVAFARNFYDTDASGVREILVRWNGPMLVVHGREDILVPVEAALEHHRIVPQSELRLLEANHFVLFRDPEPLAREIARFVERVEAGHAATRSTALPERVRNAERPYDPGSAPPAKGLTLILVSFLIVVATLVSEDAACIGVGFMVAHGRIEYLPGVLACLTGIVLGDVGLFLAGRHLGKPFIHRAPVRWFIKPEQVEQSRTWFERKGLIVIVGSRFFPGTRLPAFFAAGMMGMRLRVFLLYFLVASVLWTPFLVGLSALVGRTAIGWFEEYRRFTLPVLLLFGTAMLFATRFVTPLLTHAGRRRVVGWWTRFTRWEFWPPWVFYPPVILRILRLGLRAKHPTAFTAANPAIPAGGFVGESKHAILQGLSGSAEHVARSALVAATLPPERREIEVRRFTEEGDGSYPVVLKPDAGQRGAGVAVLRSGDEVADYLREARGDLIVQEYVAGDEFGVFHYRFPGQERGKVFSVTEKRMPVVVGDGKRTLAHLILADPRHVALSRVYLAANPGATERVPPEGEEVRLVELGTHCRGAIFLDGARIVTPEFEEVFDRISRGFEGFYFGRYDVRTPSVDDLRRGRNFKVIELNGVTSEATHIYDPKTPLVEAYRVLREQWKIAYEIGEANMERGHPATPLLELARLAAEYRRRSSRIGR